MIPELGHFALILALCMAVVQGLFPILGTVKGNDAWVAMAKPAALAHLLFITIAYGCLTWAFVVNDFSVAYVATNSNTSLPFIYLISGVWGAHEGSLLLWALLLALWTGAVVLFSRSVPGEMVARVVAVMGLVSIGFLLFMLLTSNPFDRLMPAPLEGRDLNPLLQDPGLIIHPPLLYMGYVGFSVAFAFALAAMIGGRLDAAWVRWTRPWTTIAWMFLTLGIALGSWWAYYELGWGGWWFWDPVENASFMPWLVGTALMHSLAVTEKRGTFKAWSVLLAIFAFSLCLLGTFLVRSGVLTSVHAFATDPARGVFILLFLVIVVGGSLAIYAWRAPQLVSAGRFKLFSRETALLLNNVILVVACVSVLLGTLYPLAIDALGLGKISVGPPYFNSVFIPLTAPLALLLGVGIMVRWKQDKVLRLVKKLSAVAIVSLIAGTASAAMAPQFHLLTLFGMTLAFWITLTTLQGLYERIAGKGMRGLMAVPRSYMGMAIAHIGVAIFIVGLTLTSSYSTEKDVRLAPGESYEMGGYSFLFKGARGYQGPNFLADEGHVVVTREGEMIADLHPQKRRYLSGMPMTEAAIDAGLTRDLFVAMGEPLGEGGAWSLRLYHKPFVRWLWLAAIFMAVGATLAASDRRYRLFRRTHTESAVQEEGA